MSTTANLANTFQPEPKICAVGGKGVLLPFAPSEQTWSKGPRAFIYLLVLAWCFLGVGIISDVFMNAIDVVTSKRKVIRLKNGQELTVKVWNDTVANLSLMALGSSAPEIMLNVIEIVCRGFFSGDLGPSTIVGSAAFNLMVIIAVCVTVIPEGDSRTIESVEPFLVTAFFSIFAYIWMVIILAFSSPDIVTIPEACVTFLFFPILIVIAYMADIGMFNFNQEEENPENVEFIKSKVMEAGFELTTEETKMLARMKTAEFGGTRSWAAARVEASPIKPHGIPKQDLQVGFVTGKYCFSSDVTQLTLMVEKFGENQSLVENARVYFEYTTVDGSSMRSEDGDYIQSVGSGEIEAKESYAEINIKRKPGQPAQESLNGSHMGKKVSLDSGAKSFFYVEITSAIKMPSAGSAAARRQSAKGPQEEEEHHGAHIHLSETTGRTQVAIAPMEGPGKLRMDSDEVDIAYPERETVARIKVKRVDGSDGEISCSYYVEEDSAKAGIDYLAREGELVFPTGCVEKVIEVPVMKKVDPTSQEKFVVVLSSDESRRLVEGQTMSTVTIFGIGDTGIEQTTKVLKALDTAFFVADSIAKSRALNNDWADQFKEAFLPECGDEEEATAADWTMHIIALPWKVLFAFTPPASYCGGWLAFCTALVMIGGVTVFIGDLATLIGCVLNVNSSITAITIVALGTSLPDTFASKTSAVQDDTADASIGNVTGSNSVNVFLGLGLPWVIGAIYWNIKGKTPEWIYRYPEVNRLHSDAQLVVLAGDLTFSVCCFTLCAVCTLSVIWYRRQAFQAELGGPQGVKTNTSIFLVLLWIFYVSMASWKVINGDVSATNAVMAVLVGLLCVMLGMMFVSGTINFIYWRFESRRAEMKEIFEDVLAARDEARSEAAADTDKEQKRRGSAKDGSLLSLTPAPAILEGLRLKLPEAVAQLRQYVEALNGVCTSLESEMAKAPPRPKDSGEGATAAPQQMKAVISSVEDDVAPPKRAWKERLSQQVSTPVPVPQPQQEDASMPLIGAQPQAPVTPDGTGTYDDDEEGGEGKRPSRMPQLKKKRLKKIANSTKAPEAQGATEGNDEEKDDLLDSLDKDQ